MKTVRKLCVIVPALLLACAILFTGCPNNAGGGTQSGPDPNLKIEGTVLKGYRGEKPTGVLEIPDGITEIAKDAFKQCTGLTQVKFPASLTAIRETAFIGCMGLTELNLPVKLTTVENYAFYGCKNIPEIVLPEKLNTLGLGAFGGCTGLNSLTVHEHNTVFESENNLVYKTGKTELVCACAGSTTVTLPETVETIASNAFNRCEKLIQVNLPSSLTTIENFAFGYCIALPQVNLPKNLKKISGAAFYGCTKLTSLTVNSASTYLCAIDNIVYTADKKKLLCTIPKPASPSLTLSEGLEEIAASAFSGCTSLTSVTFPASLKKIGGSAFRGCSGVSEFDFSSCTTPPLDSIGNYAFSGCTAATYKVKSGSGVKEKLTASGVAVGQITEVP